MRARAHKDRWTEESVLVKNEMAWSINWYGAQQQRWEERATLSDDDGFLGHAAYARRQAAMWASLRNRAGLGFGPVMEQRALSV